LIEDGFQLAVQGLECERELVAEIVVRSGRRVDDGRRVIAKLRG
jgi:hypothetical protein